MERTKIRGVVDGYAKWKGEVWFSCVEQAGSEKHRVRDGDLNEMRAGKAQPCKHVWFPVDSPFFLFLRDPKREMASHS